MFYTDTARLTQKLRSIRSNASRILRKSELSVHMVNYVCMYVQWSQGEVQVPAHLEPDGPHSDHPTVCIMTQHDYSTTLSLRFYYRKEKFCWHFKMLSFRCFLLFKRSLSLKLRNLKLLSRGVSPVLNQTGLAT
jgi:hypothetical protein